MLLAYRQRFVEALAAAQRAVVLSGGDADAQLTELRILIMSRRLDAADTVVTRWEVSRNPALRYHALDLRAILQRERGQFRASVRTMDRAIATHPEFSFLELVRGNSMARAGDYAGASRLYERLTHVPESRRSGWARGKQARAFAWHYALLADAIAPLGDTVRLRALADSIETIGRRSYYRRDWRLHHHVRGLIALHASRYEQAVREFAQAQWVAAHGWTRSLAEKARAEMALGRPLDAVTTLRAAYASHPEAMGRYLPRSEVDYLMALAFRQAGQADSAAIYADYVTRAWRDADPEVKRLLIDLPPRPAR
jgi:tetratricopeptide (TPR) repeat protein